MATLLHIVELITRPVEGLVVDIRTRNADGSLRYDWQDKDGPRLVKMKSVEVRKQKDGNWLYWTWDKNPNAVAFDCGYSGIRMDSKDLDEYYIEAE